MKLVILKNWIYNSIGLTKIITSENYILESNNVILINKIKL